MTDNNFVPLPAGYALSDGTVLPVGSVRLGDGTVRLPDGSILPGVVIPAVETVVEQAVVEVPVERVVQVEENPVVVQTVQPVPQPVPAPRPVVQYTPEPEPSFWSRWWWLPLLALLGLGLLLFRHGTPTPAVTHTETVHVTHFETHTVTED